MLATVEINHDQHTSFTQSCLTDAVSVILNGLLSYEHPPKGLGHFLKKRGQSQGEEGLSKRVWPDRG